MNMKNLRPWVQISITAIFVWCGCEKTPAPPPPLAVEQIPVAFNKTFGKVKPQLKEPLTQMLTAVQDRDYTKASTLAQALADQPDLTKEQRLLMARAMLTLNGLLQAAQSQGDANAAAVLKLQHMAK